MLNAMGKTEVRGIRSCVWGDVKRHSFLFFFFNNMVIGLHESKTNKKNLMSYTIERA